MPPRSLVLAPALLVGLILAPSGHAWTCPIGGPVLRPFSFADNPYAGGLHRGVDLGGDTGAPVRAPAGGTVSFVGSVPDGGRAITIQTADGYALTLLQLGSTLVSRGAVVEEGAVVGSVGTSEDAVTTAPHLHLGVRVASEPEGYVDPLGLVPVCGEAAPTPPPAEAVPAPLPVQPSADAEPSAADVPVEAAPAPVASGAGVEAASGAVEAEPEPRASEPEAGSSHEAETNVRSSADREPSAEIVSVDAAAVPAVASGAGAETASEAAAAEPEPTASEPERGSSEDAETTAAEPLVQSPADAPAAQPAVTEAPPAEAIAAVPEVRETQPTAEESPLDESGAAGGIGVVAAGVAPAEAPRVEAGASAPEAATSRDTVAGSQQAERHRVDTEPAAGPVAAVAAVPPADPPQLVASGERADADVAVSPPASGSEAAFPVKTETPAAAGHVPAVTEALPVVTEHVSAAAAEGAASGDRVAVPAAANEPSSGASMPHGRQAGFPFVTASLPAGSANATDHPAVTRQSVEPSTHPSRRADVVPPFMRTGRDDLRRRPKAEAGTPRGPDLPTRTTAIPRGTRVGTDGLQRQLHLGERSPEAGDGGLGAGARRLSSASLLALALVLALVACGVVALLRTRRPGPRRPARIMAVDEPAPPEAGVDPGCTGVAVRGRAPSHRPRGGLRRPVRRLRPLPPAARQPRADGQRHGRARNAGDGRGRQRGRVSA
jgi:hypothetical protein